MPSVINTNIPSLNTQRNLGSSQAALSTSIQRLSTGLRVNSARDDAAGLAIAERMGAQVRGLNVAARNANDAVSLAQTAEGALGKVGEMVQRIRELAVQSSNATNSTSDREALQAEVDQLKEEIDRVAKTTQFNGKALLDGTFSKEKFQVGSDAGQSIEIDQITNTQLSSIQTKTNAATGGAITTFEALATGDITINVGTLPGPVVSYQLDAIAAPAALTQKARANQIADAINAQAFKSGVSATVDTVSDAVVISSASEFTISFAGAGAASATNTGFADGAASVAGGAVNMSALSVTTRDGAQLAIQQADDALKLINTSRAKLGAVQSRFENAIANIQITAENVTAARSRIMDTDFAAETANMTRAQILQQAGTAMLSQANQLPQQVLSLLR
ncbi:flagellin [uncultured Ramlibacter sp.]|uniref:flagellin n=1 Tax=uncultured Ramlibacter sp. TaxID=260755 RepID=UPI00260D9D63|nr:flagellin [uncultured Ramlibacter sp.]